MTSASGPRVRDIETPTGLARAHITRPAHARGSLVLGHGAGGRQWTGDLVSVAQSLTDQGYAVVLVEQPWRVAGRKAAGPPHTLDAAWVPVLAALTRGRGALPRPLVSGGRSAGARVACRTATDVGADAVLCLAFPLHPPAQPQRSRADELRLPFAAGLPAQVVQGANDPWGSPAEVRAQLADFGDPTAYVTAVHGSHSFGRAPRDVVAAVEAFVGSLG
jgi:predicted alpha/beta-hydrolase family hydrolase